MKVTIDRDVLNRTLAEPCGLAGGLVQLAVTGGTMAVIGDDGAVRIEQRVPVDHDGDGIMMVAAGLLRAVAKAMPSGPVTLTAADGQVELHGVGDDDNRTGEFRSSLRQTPVGSADFPLPPVIPNRVGMLDLREFADVMGRVLPAVSADLARPLLTGVSINPMPGDSGRLMLVGSDSYRLHMVKTGMCDVGVWNETAVVPSKAVTLIARVFHGQTEADLFLDSKLLSVQSATCTVTARLIDGAYPDYTLYAKTPRRVATTATVTTAAMLEAIDRTRLVADLSHDRRGVGLLTAYPEQNLLVIEASATEIGDAVASIPATSVTGDGFTCRFMLSWLATAVKAARSERVELRFVSDMEALRISGFGDNRFQALVMPNYTPK